MRLNVEARVVATARFSEHAAADDRGAWIVSDRPLRLFSRNQAITALTITELLAIGYYADPVPGGQGDWRCLRGRRGRSPLGKSAA